LLVGVGCGWMTVFGPATESSTYVLLGPVAAGALLRAWLRRSPAWSWALVGAGYGILVATQVTTWFPWGRAFQTLGPQPLAGLLLLSGTVGAEFVRTPGTAGRAVTAPPAEAA
jgi:hypothetical protein